MTKPLTAEPVDGMMIRLIHCRQPHKINVLFNASLHPATAVNIIEVTIHQHLQKHPWMITAGANCFILFQNNINIEPVYHLTYYPYRMIGCNHILEAGWKKILLILLIGFEHRL